MTNFPLYSPFAAPTGRCTAGGAFFAKGHVLKFDFEWFYRKDGVLGPGKNSNGGEIRRLYAEIELLE